MNDPTKRCPACGGTKPLGDFHKDSRKPDGRRSRCKQCTNADQRAFQHEHKARTGRYYSRQFGKPQVEQTCQACGKIFKRANVVRSCSPRCQQIIKRRGQRAKARLKQARAKLATAARGTRGSAPFIAGPCGSCGRPLVSRKLDMRWCSIECKRRQKAARRRARERDAFVEEVSPFRIFERDKWTCQLCHRKVKRTAVAPHPQAPVLDHIIPLAAHGTHEPTNVQCAHFLCNSAKRELGGGEQLLLIG